MINHDFIFITHNKNKQESTEIFLKQISPSNLFLNQFQLAKKKKIIKQSNCNSHCIQLVLRQSLLTNYPQQ